jgi:hypothetical protein
MAATSCIQRTSVRPTSAAFYSLSITGRVGEVPRPSWAGIATAVFLGLCAGPLRAQCPDGTPLPCGPRRPALQRGQVLGFDSEDTAEAYISSRLSTAWVLGTLLS